MVTLFSTYLCTSVTFLPSNSTLFVYKISASSIYLFLPSFFRCSPETRDSNPRPRNSIFLSLPLHLCTILFFLSFIDIEFSDYSLFILCNMLLALQRWNLIHISFSIFQLQNILLFLFSSVCAFVRQLLPILLFSRYDPLYQLHLQSLSTTLFITRCDLKFFFSAHQFIMKTFFFLLSLSLSLSFYFLCLSFAFCRP